ncbi:MAG: hypothetical protein JWN03_4393 [Nocardia sp.]|nr:hypothetical protein [Nocardia sp.]MCU1644118.1 hypothetical protein [Nocardia sp.]
MTKDARSESNSVEASVEEPEVDYKIVAFGGVEVIPEDVEEEVERL